MPSLLLKNATVITPGTELEHVGVFIEDGKIQQVGKNPPRAIPDRTIDVQEQIVAPGFIDIHTHGAGGASAMDGTEDAMRTMAKFKLREGVTTFLPTTWTASEDDLHHAMEGIAAYMKRQDFAKTPAVHIEGPFINPNCVGAQNPAFVRPPCMTEIEALAQIAEIALVSLAVEMEDGMDFVRLAKERHIRTSLAHTDATYAQFLEAKELGLNHLTHFCNQMTKLHHREIGVVGAGLLDDDILIEMICDKIHLCPEMIALTFKFKSPEQIMLITDSISASWQPDGDYDDAGQPVKVIDGICRLENGALAGSTLRFNQALKNVHEISGKPLSELIRTTSWNQAQSFGWRDLGKVEEGFVADLVVLDRDTLEPITTIVDGAVRFEQ